MSTVQTFFPVGSHSFSGQLADGQRYRNDFGDARLERRHEKIISSMLGQRSGKASHLSNTRSERTATYRFLANEKVSLGELIALNTKVNPSSIAGRRVLCLLDSCTISLGLGNCNTGEKPVIWANECGVTENNKTPGFSVMPSLLVDEDTDDVMGLGDMLFYSRPIAPKDKSQRDALRKARVKLELERKQSSSWLYTARNTSAKVSSAARSTFVMDQGGDQYEVLERILSQLENDFIVRSKTDRVAKNPRTAEVAKMSVHLDKLDFSAERLTPIRALNHYSKSSGKLVRRSARMARLQMRSISLTLMLPANLKKTGTRIERPLTLVEVIEHPDTVPLNEKPIHWKLLTSWEADDPISAWEVVDAYCKRWHIEQLFRVLKRGGIDIESSQLGRPNKIKKLLVMALKASADAIRLTNNRQGKVFVPIEEMFNPNDQAILVRMNQRMSKSGTKVVNPHDEKSLAWAAWVIARMGGWDGYESQRPPGPIIMHRGLLELENARFYAGIFNDT